jgi:hypothetical protein
MSKLPVSAKKEEKDMITALIELFEQIGKG